MGGLRAGRAPHGSHLGCPEGSERERQGREQPPLRGLGPICGRPTLWAGPPCRWSRRPLSLPLRATGPARGQLGNHPASGTRGDSLELSPHTCGPPACVSCLPTRLHCFELLLPSIHLSPCLSALPGPATVLLHRTPRPSGPLASFGFGHREESWWSDTERPRQTGGPAPVPCCPPPLRSLFLLLHLPAGLMGTPQPSGAGPSHPQCGLPNPSHVEVMALGQLTPS